MGGIGISYQAIFARYELKYMITDAQKQLILDAIAPYTVQDRYGRTSVRSLYLDTPDHLLIRRSIEKPDYKEKLRMRSYGRAEDDADVFAEIKKKYRGMVYKRRVALPWCECERWLSFGGECPINTQISREIEHMRMMYAPLRPTVFISYFREAYYGRGTDLRITFDSDILADTEQLTLSRDVCGMPLLESGIHLMEIKCGGGVPLWLVRILSRERIYKSSFSKYGTAYREMIHNKKELSLNVR